MSRYAKPNVTTDDLKEIIDSKGGVYEILYGDSTTQQLINDLKKIEFDCENVTDPDDDEGFDMPGFQHGYDTLPNGVAVCWCGAGGDWESPLALCLYVGDNGALRAYIPKNGNAYNFKTKKAIGNWNVWGDESDDDEDELEKFGLVYEFDMAKLRADAAKRIQFKH